MTEPTVNVKTFPYRRKWAQVEINEILVRQKRLADALTDAVAPAGIQMNINATWVNYLATHLALAGGDVHDELAYIVAEIINHPGGMADFHHWHLKSEYTPPTAPDPDETTRKATAAADQIRRQLTPEVRREVAAMMLKELEEYQKATTEDGEP